MRSTGYKALPTNCLGPEVSRQRSIGFADGRGERGAADSRVAVAHNVQPAAVKPAAAMIVCASFQGFANGQAEPERQ